MAILTDKNSAPEVTLADLIHIVDVSDTTANPLGTSKKASIQQLRDLITSSVDQFTELTDTPANYTGAAGQVVRVNGTEDGLEYYTLPTAVSDFLGLTDTPSAYTGAAGYFLTVNSTPDGVQFVNPSAIGLSAFNNDAGFITSAPNIYTDNGTLTGNRTVDLGTNTLDFNNGFVSVGNTAQTGTYGELLGVDGAIRANNSAFNSTFMSFNGQPIVANNIVMPNNFVINMNASTIRNTGASNNILTFTESNGFSFQNNGLTGEYLRILSGSGNVGIGTTTPSEKLHVNGNARVDGNINISSKTNAYQIEGVDFLKASQTVGSWDIMLGNGATGTNSGNGGFISIGQSANSSENGIAIGLASSVGTSTFDGIAIGRNAIIPNSTTRGIAIGRNSTVTGNETMALGHNVTATATNQYRYGKSATINVFDGSVGIGTTTPSEKLHVNGNARVDGRLAVNTTTNSTDKAIIKGDSTTGALRTLHLVNSADTTIALFRNDLQTYLNGPTQIGTGAIAEAGVSLVAYKSGVSPSGYVAKFKSDATNTMLAIRADGLVGIGTEAPTQVLGVNGRINILDTTGTPSTPTGSGTLYVEAGALKYKGSSGTVTTIANA